MDELMDMELDQKVKQLSKVALQILKAPDSFWLYSLDPVPADLKSTRDQAKTNHVAKEVFHGYEILGGVEIEDKQQQQALVKSLVQGMSEAKGIPPACFNPRHGIRAAQGGEKVDLLICFECSALYEFAKTTNYGRTSYSPAKVFNEALKRANLPIAPEEH